MTLRTLFLSAAVLLFSLAPSLGQAQEKMKKVKLNSSISGRLPSSLHPMTDSDVMLRLPSVRKPLASYSSEDRTVGFSINQSATQWRPQDLPMAKDFFKSSILNLYDKVDFLQDGIQEINGRHYAVFEFESYISANPNALDRKSPLHKYNYIQYTLVGGKTLVFTFSCPARKKEAWQHTAGRIMESIKIKGGI